MKAALFSLVFAASAFAQSFTINTPANVAQCQPLQITWSGGNPPYFLTVNPGSQPNGPPLVNLGEQNGTSFSWTQVNVQANTQIGFSLRDSSGAIAQTAAVTVNDSGDSSCLGQTPSGSGGTAAPPPATTPTGGAGGGSTAGATTSGGASSGGSSTSRTSAGSGTTTGSGASTTTSPNGASANVVQVGAAGIIGAAIAALLA
ncbi:hypothetical protein AGABI1DRAFT_85658 [Agaricus bisporus var. burnettii JB137-S8]|uniref:Uncharacterized protein n=1 Tax=Agaricus bisporus var. burnettii (strain JB137-S8 / ATCC MYA-4627 / FGSC 10392) TaxID=597362 RepID=K5X709_AGABU|nr:uncharacterized protein AGABI1DRAFT_85658 [Agaricus bisporus var. burnettii JB137-S8]EKM78752.1 hypothetical protein AGABI1DRAFT_85658 [Agaricus bisporus var. burnettii JB137-S8]